MVNKFRLLGFSAAILLVSGVAFAQQQGNADAGRTKFVSCQGCHGTNGISVGPEWPNLAGQKEQYIINQLENFQSGKRTNPIMSPIAKTLSQQDIRDIAAFVSTELGKKK